MDGRLSEPPRDGDSAFGLSAGDRRLAFSRQPSFHQSFKSPHTPVSIYPDDPSRPFLSRNASAVGTYEFRGVEIDDGGGGGGGGVGKVRVLGELAGFLGSVRYGNKYMKKLFWLISLNVACSTTELGIGLLTGRVGLVSDAFHLTFGCGLLTFSLFAMAASRKKPDRYYTYGYKRLEVLSAFTNAIFLLFMSFSLAVEALHAFIQDESEHKHYLIVSAVTNLIVNLIGVWFFRSYARVNLGGLYPKVIPSLPAVYRRAEDINNHSVCLHVLADSIRSAGLIFASWLLSMGVQNAEVLCLGVVSVAVFTLVKPLFKASGGILLQMAPPGIHTSALSKCWRQVTSREDVLEISQARFWELVPGHSIGCLSVQVKKGTSDQSVVQFVHHLYHDLGIQDLTVQTDV